MRWLIKLFESFRFLTRYRLRQAAKLEKLAEERRLEREHQALLLKTFLTSLETIQETSARESSANAEALIAVAASVSEQAKGFAEWFKCFQVGTPPTTSTVTDEDEYRAEQERNLAAGLPADISVLPEEFRLAWTLKNDPNWLGQNEQIKP